MPRQRKRNPTEFGRVMYGQDGLPLAFFPPNSGISHRLRYLDDVERKYHAGQLSLDDLERSRAAYRERA